MALTTLAIPSTNTILQSMLNDYKAISNYYGYNLTVDPGSELYIRFSGISQQIAIMYNITNTLTLSKLISTSQGDDLTALAGDFGLQRRGATSAIGFVQLIAGVAQTLIVGSLLTGPNGLQYQVSQTGTYNINANVPISSVDQGSQTNLPVGSIMSWSSPQTNMQSTTIVTVSLTGGADAEDDNSLRNRLYFTLQAPPQMGNGQQLVTIAGSTDGVIQAAFVYSNFNGAGSQLVALTGYQTFSYIGRDIPHLPTDGYASQYNVNQLSPGLLVQNLTNSGFLNGYGAYNAWSLGTDNVDATPETVSIGNPGPNLSNDTAILYGQIPGVVANPFATVITTVNNYPADLAAVLTLPYPVGSSINGYGNGWQDSNPWPNPDGYYVNSGYCQVVSVSNSTQITIAAPSSYATGGIHINGNGLSGASAVSQQTYNINTPTNGATHIQWVNRSDFNNTGWAIVTATVLASTDNANDTWTLTLDTPLVFPTDGYDFYNNTGVAVGDFIFPASINAQNYLNNVMQQFALLGPGQTTTNQGLLVLGASRYPSSNSQYPSTVGVQLERALVNNNQEVYAATVSSQTYKSGAQPNYADAYNTAFFAPPVNAPPNCYVPRNIAFYSVDKYGFGTGQ